MARTPVGDIAVGGQQDDFRNGRGFPKLFYQIDPVSVGQFDITENDVEGFCAKYL